MNTERFTGIPRCLVGPQTPGLTGVSWTKFESSGQSLKGRVEISGAKTCSLARNGGISPDLGTVYLDNIPYVRDILTTRRLLQGNGS